MPEYSDPVRPRSSTQRRGKTAAHAAWNLSFSSAATSVSVSIVQNSRTLLVAAAEDLRWRLAVQD